MNPLDIIAKYYPVGSEAYRILVIHSRSVADKALAIARMHPEMNLDLTFVEEAAMLHDIGIFRCNAPDIDCHGNRDFMPETLEEQLICYADKFYSKTKLDKEKSVEKVKQGLSKYGNETVERFDNWCKLFLGE